MGASTSKVLSDIGSVVGNAIAAPFKSIFGRSCENLCGGIWDVVCFIEHICILDLIKFVLACCLCYICLVFLYLLYKLGLCQCIARSLCKMCWAACETYWLTLDYVCCYCWYKIRYTKRVYRGRHRLQRQLSRDVELGYISPSPYTSGDESFDDFRRGSTLARKRKSYREQSIRRRRRRRRRKLSHGSSLRLRRGHVSVRFKGRSSRRSGRSMRRNQSKHFGTSSLGRRKRCNSTRYKKPRLSHHLDSQE